ncbi:MAG: VWA domain-containing protein, partial [Woeseiaceae bacterium]
GLDIAGLVDYITDRRHGETSNPLIYEKALPTDRDMSVLVLLDATNSTNEEIDGGPIFEKERHLAGQLTASLDELGDQVAMYGFYSRGKDFVRFLRIKAFDDAFDTAAKRRLADVQPAGFTRLGAALRHGAHLLATEALTRNMVLVVIGDGLPYDDGYEGSYARADTRKAIHEAVRSGVGVVGLAIRSSTAPAIHQDIWSEVPFRVVANSDDVRAHVRSLFTDALGMTRTNGRRRERPATGEHLVPSHVLSRLRRSNSYV